MYSFFTEQSNCLQLNYEINITICTFNKKIRYVQKLPFPVQHLKNLLIKNILFLITSNNTFDQIKQNEEAQNWSVCRSWCTLTFHLTGKSSRHFSATWGDSSLGCRPCTGGWQSLPPSVSVSSSSLWWSHPLQATQDVTTRHYTSQHNTSQHVTTRHDTTRHNTSQHVTIQHVTSHHKKTRHNTSNTSRHVTSRHVTSRHVTTCHVMSCHVTTQHNMSQHIKHITSRHVTSRHVTSRHVTSCHITTQHTVSTHLTQTVKLPFSVSITYCEVYDRYKCKSTQWYPKFGAF